MSQSRRWARAGLASFFGLALCACSSEDPLPTDAGTNPTESVTRTIGAQGGLVEGSGWALDIPAGALDSDVEITITEGVAATLPANVARKSPAYGLEPAGLTFSTPVAFTIELEEAVDDVVMYWGDAAGQFAPIPTTASGLEISGETSHFSGPVLARACAKTWCDGQVLMTRTGSPVPQRRIQKCESQTTSLDCAALPQASASTCDAATAACALVCDVGFADCDPTAPGCDTDIRTDSSHCGVCNRACDPGVSCVGGHCEGQDPCAGDPCVGRPNECVDSTTQRVFDGSCVPDANEPLGYSCESNEVACTGDLVCEGGACVTPGVCPTDDQEGTGGNDTPATATVLAAGTAVEGVVCGNFDRDIDVFAIDAPEAGCRLKAHLLFTTPDGWPRAQTPGVHNPPARLRLLGPDQGQLVERWANQVGIGMQETLAAAGQHWLRVATTDDDADSVYGYRLDYELVCPPAAFCPPDDTYEPNSRSNDELQSLAVGGPRVDAVICNQNQDRDYFFATLTEACLLKLQLWSESAFYPTLEDHSSNPVGRPVLQNSSGSGTYASVFAPEVNTRHHVLVSARRQSFEYQLDLSSVCPQTSCTSPEAYEPNNVIAQATLLPLFVGGSGTAHVDASLCGADVDLYGPMPQADYVNVTLVYDSRLPSAPTVTVIDGDGEEVYEGTPDERGRILRINHSNPLGTFLKVESNEYNRPYLLLIELGFFS